MNSQQPHQENLSSKTTTFFAIFIATLVVASTIVVFFILNERKQKSSQSTTSRLPMPKEEPKPSEPTLVPEDEPRTIRTNDITLLENEKKIEKEDYDTDNEEGKKKLSIYNTPTSSKSNTGIHNPQDYFSFLLDNEIESKEATKKRQENDRYVINNKLKQAYQSNKEITPILNKLYKNIKQLDIHQLKANIKNKQIISTKITEKLYDLLTSYINDIYSISDLLTSPQIMVRLYENYNTVLKTTINVLLDAINVKRDINLTKFNVERLIQESKNIFNQHREMVKKLYSQTNGDNLNTQSPIKSIQVGYKINNIENNKKLHNIEEDPKEQNIDVFYNDKHKDNLELMNTIKIHQTQLIDIMDTFTKTSRIKTTEQDFIKTISTQLEHFKTLDDLNTLYKNKTNKRYINNTERNYNKKTPNQGIMKTSNTKSSNELEQITNFKMKVNRYLSHGGHFEKEKVTKLFMSCFGSLVSSIFLDIYNSLKLIKSDILVLLPNPANQCEGPTCSTHEDNEITTKLNEDDKLDTCMERPLDNENDQNNDKSQGESELEFVEINNGNWAHILKIIRSLKLIPSLLKKIKINENYQLNKAIEKYTTFITDLEIEEKIAQLQKVSFSFKNNRYDEIEPNLLEKYVLLCSRIKSLRKYIKQIVEINLFLTQRVSCFWYIQDLNKFVTFITDLNGLMDTKSDK